MLALLRIVQNKENFIGYDKFGYKKLFFATTMFCSAKFVPHELFYENISG